MLIKINKIGTAFKLSDAGGKVEVGLDIRVFFVPIKFCASFQTTDLSSAAESAAEQSAEAEVNEDSQAVREEEANKAEFCILFCFVLFFHYSIFCIVLYFCFLFNLCFICIPPMSFLLFFSIYFAYTVQFKR